MPRSKGPNLEEIQAAFADKPFPLEFPPILQPKQFAKLLNISPSTVYFWMSQGRLDGAHRKRGKRQFIWRDRAIDLILNGPEWGNDEGQPPKDAVNGEDEQT
jgi:hypothetical protein